MFYPLTELSVLFALLSFFLLARLAEAAGLLGLWLAVVILPAYFRYLLHLLEARANDREPSPPGIELFNWVENFWSLLPLAILCLTVWAEYLLLEHFSQAAAIIAGLLALVFYPASVAVLALTHSPLQSLNPVVLLRVIRGCGRDYIIVPLLVTAMVLLLVYLGQEGVARAFLQVLAMYATFLLFTLTGAVIREHAGTFAIDMPPERQPGHGHLEAKLTRERAAVLNHAYGFVSRGNRQGGLRHITGWIQGEADIDSAYRWFIEQMMAWESADAALALAQSYLSRLLEQRRDIEALKLINRCLLENAEFKPLPGDRAKALAAAKRQGNEELLRILMD